MEDRLHYFFYFRLTSHRIGKSTIIKVLGKCLSQILYMACLTWTTCNHPEAVHFIHDFWVGRLYEGESSRHDTSWSKNSLPTGRFMDFITILKSACDACIASHLCSINLKTIRWRRSSTNLLVERNFKKIATTIACHLTASKPNILISMNMTLTLAPVKGYVPATQMTSREQNQTHKSIFGSCVQGTKAPRCFHMIDNAYEHHMSFNNCHYLDLHAWSKNAHWLNCWEAWILP